MSPAQQHAPTLWAEDIDAAIHAGCMVPGCTHDPKDHTEMVFTCKCHPRAGIYATAALEACRLLFRCRECNTLICSFAIARRADQNVITAAE